MPLKTPELYEENSVASTAIETGPTVARACNNEL
jgi:hypothetical protein